MKMIIPHRNALEQRLLVEALNLVRIIQAAPRTTRCYTLTLPVEIVDALGQGLQDYVESMFAVDDDMDKEESHVHQNFD